MLRHLYPRNLDEVADFYQEGARDSTSAPDWCGRWPSHGWDGRCADTPPGAACGNRTGAAVRAAEPGRGELGEYEFTVKQGGELRRILGKPGTAVSVDVGVAPAFRSAGSAQGRLLFVHVPAALEEFFGSTGSPSPGIGEPPEDLEPPEFGAMAAALERDGVKVVGPPEGVHQFPGVAQAVPLRATREIIRRRQGQPL